MTIQTQLQKIRERAEKATPGPWDFERQSFDDGEFSYELNTNEAFIAIREGEYEKPMKAKFDSEFIAHARTDVPKLIACVERLVEAITPALEDFEDCSCDDPEVTGHESTMCIRAIELRLSLEDASAILSGEPKCMNGHDLPNWEAHCTECNSNKGE